MNPAEHCVVLPGMLWPVWRWVLLRSAGFPYSPFERLTAPDSARAADELLTAEAATQAARLRLLTELRPDFTNLPEAVRKGCVEAARRVWQGKVPGKSFALVEEALPAAGAALRAWTLAAAAQTEASRRFDGAYEAELPAVRRALRELVADDRLREAILWQSGSALRAFDALRADGLPTRSRDVRRNEQLCTMYLQRYVAKNDTIGFFGPVGWGTIAQREAPLSFTPSAELIAGGKVFFEHWGIDQLAQNIAADDDAKGALRPRLLPTHRLVGSTLFHPIGRSTELPASYARIVGQCDGHRTIEDIATRIAAGDPEGFASSDEVIEAIDELVEESVLTCRIPLPTCHFHPLEWLRSELARMPEVLRGRWLPVVDELERLRHDVESARGSVAREAAMQRLRTRFEEVSGEASLRREGGLYAARSIVYLDCARGVDELDLGEQVLRELAGPLELVYATARWFLEAVIASLERRWLEIHASLAASESAVDYLRFYSAIEGTLSVESLAEPLAAVHRTWSELLGLRSLEERRVTADLATLRPGIATAFGGAQPRWPQARIHSPDLMIAAATPQAIRDGDYCVVLGEVHIGTNTICVPTNLEQVPERVRNAIWQAHHRDLPDYVQPVTPRELFHRATIFSPDFPTLVEFETGDTASALPSERVLRVGDLSVVREEDRLVVVDRGGGRRIELPRLLGHALMLLTIDKLKLVEGPHTPRITVGKVVLQRERWTLDALGSEIVDGGFIGIRRWARSHGIPRRFFAKVAEEGKPFLVDLDNPLLVEVFAKLAGETKRLSVSEMLPEPEQLWLHDRDGARYTSELRIAAVDPGDSSASGSTVHIRNSQV